MSYAKKFQKEFFYNTFFFYKTTLFLKLLKKTVIEYSFVEHFLEKIQAVKD